MKNGHVLRPLSSAMHRAIESCDLVTAAADATGYARLMEQDEAGTLATLRLYREAMRGLITRHGGRS